MTESPTPPQHRRGGNLQTKALAGLVAIMLAAAIVALVFVTNGSGTTNDDRAGGSPSDVGRTSSAATQPASPRTSSATTGSAPTSSATKSTAAPSTTKPSTTRPSTTKPSTAPASTPADAGGASTTSKPATNASSSHATASKKVVYTVKKGDTLTDIGRWYSDHGYLTLYDWNKSVIGENPDLIFPGQKIIVVDGNVGVARH